MKFNLWTQYGALNSKPVFDAFSEGAKSLGHEVGYNADHGIDVIWSVLFNGRMAANRSIWQQNQKQKKPTIVLEVGGINRSTTWKVGLNGINRDAYFGEQNNDRSRADHLGLVCKPWRSNGDFILIAGQHDKSLQWQGMPRMSNWFLETYDEIRKHTERPILFRPHPRCRLEHIERGLKNVYRQEPRHVTNTYDDFDLGFANIWATVSYSSNPGIHSVMAGVPSFVSTHSLAYDVGNDIDFLHDIEQPVMPDRQQWLNDYAWTEFTIDEISQGIPLNRLTFQLF
jgi:hypothetical protein